MSAQHPPMESNGDCPSSRSVLPAAAARALTKNSAFFLLLACTACCFGQPATNLPPAGGPSQHEAETRHPPGWIPPETNLLATGAWSPPVSDQLGHSLQGRLVVYEGSHFTNEFYATAWHAAPVYLEIQDENDNQNISPIQVYFDVAKGLEFDLRDAQGATAANFRRGGAAPGSHPEPFWATVPPGGLVRLPANLNLISISGGEAHPLPKSGGLNLNFFSMQHAVIEDGDTNEYYLSATLLPPPTHSSADGGKAWLEKLEFPAVKITAPKH